MPSVRDQVTAALAEAHHRVGIALLAAQRGYLDEFWARADVELEGDAELQQAVRFGCFIFFPAVRAGRGAEPFRRKA